MGLFDLKGLFHRGKGVPLKGPFFAHFSQGNFGKVNEMRVFRVFNIFCFFEPASLGYSDPALLGFWSLLRLVVLGCFIQPSQPDSLES